MNRGLRSRGARRTLLITGYAKTWRKSALGCGPAGLSESGRHQCLENCCSAVISSQDHVWAEMKNRCPVQGNVIRNNRRVS